MTPDLRERLLASAAAAWLYAVVFAALAPHRCPCRMCTDT